jgi:Asp/Glu/hydantoin racemase
MNKILTTQNQIILIFILILMTTLSTCNSCNTKSEVNRLRKQTTEMKLELDTLTLNSASEKDIERMLKIEGLKSEKRMIQSTDRKILDVNRQSEIDRELESLK